MSAAAARRQRLPRRRTPLSARAYHIDAGLPAGLPYQPWAAAPREAAQRGQRARTIRTCGACPNIRRAPARCRTTRRSSRRRGLDRHAERVQRSYRQIFTDGRPLPVDPQPSWTGTRLAAGRATRSSSRRTGLRDGLWLDVDGQPDDERHAITERIRRPNFGSLRGRIHRQRSKAYTRPWTVALKQTSSSTGSGRRDLPRK